MGTLTERLQILIDADAKGAVREMETFGAKAELATKGAEDKVAKLSTGFVKFGVAAIGAGAVAAVGIKKAIDAYDEAELQQKKLTNSITNSKHAFADNGKALRDLAQDIQHKTAADGDAIVGGQAALVQMGLPEKQTNTLTPLIVDLSRKMGIDLNTAAKLVGKSVEGNAGALGRVLGPMDKAAFSADHYAATLDKLRGVQGFAETEGKTFAGQMERLKNNFHDLEESAGKGALGVINPLIQGLSSLAGSASSGGEGIGELAGKIGAVGALGSVAIGSLSRPRRWASSSSWQAKTVRGRSPASARPPRWSLVALRSWRSPRGSRRGPTPSPGSTSRSRTASTASSSHRTRVGRSRARSSSPHSTAPRTLRADGSTSPS